MQTIHMTTEVHFMQIKYIECTQSHSIMSIPVVHSGNYVHSGKGTHPLVSTSCADISAEDQRNGNEIPEAVG